MLLGDAFGGDGPNIGAISLPLGNSINGGTVSVNNNNTPNNPTDDTVIYTPLTNFNGTDTFEYTITDADGQTSTATVTVTVNGLNDAPVAVTDTYTTDEDTTVTITPLTGDTDLDGDTLVVTSINGITLTPGTAQVILVTNGTVNVDAAGVITFTPDTNYNGSISFPYVISDGNGGTATANEDITVNAVNDAPVAVTDTYTTDEDTTVTITPLTGDTDLDGDTLVVDSINGTTLTPGTAQVILVTNGTVNVDAAGVITFTPDTNYNGSISFPYVISDGNGGTATANEDITVNAVNDAPVAVTDTYTTDEDTTVTITPLTGDTDLDGDTLVVDSINGTTLTPGTAQVILVTNGTVNVDAAGVITFTPDTNYNGSISFPYVISDGNGGTATANEDITVNGLNDAPVAVTDTYTTDEDTTVTITPLTGDTDLDGDTLTVTSINGITLTPGTAQVILVTNGTVNVDAAGVITFTPDTNYNGSISFPYVISDGNGGTATANEDITVNAVNDAPVAVTDTYTTDEDTTVTITPLIGDTDLDGDTLTVTSINGTTLIPGTAQVILVPNGTVNVDAAGVITFTPDTNYNGSISFPYVISDGNGGTATANEDITVNAVNDAPVAVTDTYTTDEDTTVTITPLTGDTDLDGDTLTVTVSTEQR